MGGPFPLSLGQEQLWLLDRLGEGRAYHVGLGFDIGGPLDAAALGHALTSTVARHAALRVRIDAVDGEPHQIVGSGHDVFLRCVELDEAGHSDEDVEKLCRRFLDAPFDLRTGPLIRAMLIRRRPDAHRLVVALHHIVCDGWSLGLLTRELANGYGAALGVEDRLPPPGLEYPDFALQQREWLGGEEAEREVDCWRQRLRTAPLPALPFDRRESAGHIAGTDLERWLPDGIHSQVAAVSRVTGSGPAAVFMAAFAAALARYSGARRIPIGLPLAGRTSPEAASTIGYFVNTLPVIADLSGGPTMLGLVDQIQRDTLDLLDHQRLPLVGEVRARVSNSGGPLFNVLFNFQPEAYPAVRLAGTDVAYRRVDNSTAQFDLVLKITRFDDRYLASLRYRTGHCTPPWAGQFLNCYADVLDHGLCE
jgi:hypothetical protein